MNNNSIDEAFKKIAKEAINELSNQQSNAGCNDYEMEDTPENRLIWDAYNAQNLHISLGEWQSGKHPEFREIYITQSGKILAEDSIQIFVLEFMCGLNDASKLV